MLCKGSSHNLVPISSIVSLMAESVVCCQFFFGKNELRMNDKLKDYCTIKEKCLRYFALRMMNCGCIDRTFNEDCVINPPLSSSV